MFRFLKKPGDKTQQANESKANDSFEDESLLSDDVLSDFSDELSDDTSSPSGYRADHNFDDTRIDSLKLNLDMDDDDDDYAPSPVPSLPERSERRYSFETEERGFTPGGTLPQDTFVAASPRSAQLPRASAASQGSYQAFEDRYASEEKSFVPAFRASVSEKLPVNSQRLNELEGFTRNARSAAGQVGMAVQNLAKSHDALVNLTAFLPAIEAEFHRAEVLASEIKTLHADNASKEKQISDLKTETAIMKKELSEIRQVKDAMAADLENFKSEMAQYSINLAAIKKTNSGLESDLAFERKKNASISDQLERQGADIGALETRNSELLSEIELIGKNEAAIRREYDELQHRLEHESSSRQAIAIEHEKLKRDASRWRKELEDLEAQQEVIAGKMRAIEEDAKVRESRAQGEIFILKSETENLQSKLRLRDANERTLQAQISELNQALRNADGAAKRARRELDEKQAELERSKKEIAELNTNLSEINLNYMSDLITLDNQKQQIEQFRQSLQALNQQNQKLAQYQSLYRSAEEQIAQMQTKISEYSRELKAAKFAGIDSQRRSEARFTRSGPEDVTLPGPSDPSDSKH
jgi:chromosome segregation ATPase